MRILVAEPLAKEGLERLRAHHEVDERLGLDAAGLREIVGTYECLVVRSQVKVDAALIEAGERLVVIGRAGVGVDNVDVEAATRRGITVVNAPTGNTIAAAEMTLALLFGVARHVAAADASMRRDEWTRSKFMGLELSGRTLGIVGFGKIGQAVAARARGLAMRVIASDPFLTEEEAGAHLVDLVDLPKLLAESDVISLHVPVTRSTRGMIGAAEIALMRPTAILINTSRGEVIDEAALADALAAGKLAGAGIDVFQREPPVGSPLLGAPRILLTPHLGASTTEAQIRVAIETADNVLEVLAGRPARGAVNAPLANPEAAERLAPFLRLATTLGQLLRQVTPGEVGEVTVELGGDLSTQDPAALVAAVLLGVLGPSEERLNLVNARAVARARGIRVADRRRTDVGPYGALLTVATPTDRAWSPGPDRQPAGPNDLVPIAGTVANGEPRLTRIGAFHVDLAPAPVMLITRHEDRPGTMGRIGLMLGDAGINIGSVYLGRSAPLADALMVLALDDDVPEQVAERIRANSSVLGLWVVRLTEPG